MCSVWLSKQKKQTNSEQKKKKTKCAIIESASRFDGLSHILLRIGIIKNSYLIFICDVIQAYES